MKFLKTDIPEVIIIEPDVMGDSRGYFMESFIAGNFRKEVSQTSFIQENESSSRYGVIRGLHYQLHPYSQSKLMRVVTGKIIDVAVDLRIGSPTFARYVAVELSQENKKQMFIPRGFAHGFSVLSDNTIVQYKIDNLYRPEYERAVCWNDPVLNINWGLDTSIIILSEKDKYNPTIDKAELFDYKMNLY